MSRSILPPIPATSPPPLPRAALNAGAGYSWHGVEGTEGMSEADLYQAVSQGGRFVLYQYAFSILILTFKRSSSIKFLRSGQSSFNAQLPYSAISFFFGWWG